MRRGEPQEFVLLTSDVDMHGCGPTSASSGAHRAIGSIAIAESVKNPEVEVDATVR